MISKVVRLVHSNLALMSCNQGTLVLSSENLKSFLLKRFLPCVATVPSPAATAKEIFQAAEDEAKEILQQSILQRRFVDLCSYLVASDAPLDSTVLLKEVDSWYPPEPEAEGDLHLAYPGEEVSIVHSDGINFMLHKYTYWVACIGLPFSLFILTVLNMLNGAPELSHQGDSEFEASSPEDSGKSIPSEGNRDGEGG
ncbi:uncharacterized protein G2W53_033821 [Senna tora]|uniref:Uncharacterized protein n=1 Tax=Senna tora TaxID=362788 RepID=A0A834SZ76_9FABA|nr:uncharacterized protein G2W53_033821 [Senna tora]